jgi:hypothetical protein
MKPNGTFSTTLMNTFTAKFALPLFISFDVSKDEVIRWTWSKISIFYMFLGWAVVQGANIWNWTDGLESCVFLVRVHPIVRYRFFSIRFFEPVWLSLFRSFLGHSYVDVALRLQVYASNYSAAERLHCFCYTVHRMRIFDLQPDLQINRAQKRLSTTYSFKPFFNK